MEKFFIVAALKSEIASSSKRINQCESKVRLVFHSSMLEHATKMGNLITFDCDGFQVDEKNSSTNWRDAFNFNEEPPRGVIITVNAGYASGVVLPYKGLMKKLLKNEAYFASILGLWLSDQLSDEQKKELEQMFCLDYGGLINACNRYMIRTIKAIGNEIVSFEEFSDKDAECFANLLHSRNLDNVLQGLLSRSLEQKGSDENLLVDLEKHLESLKKV